jgi:hypothetical protein
VSRRLPSGDLVLPDLVEVLLLSDTLPHAVAELDQQDKPHDQADRGNESAAARKPGTAGADTRKPSPAGVHLDLLTRSRRLIPGRSGKFRLSPRPNAG